MIRSLRFLAAAVATGALAAPAVAQYQPYPNQPAYNYPAYPGYPGQPAYQQPYTNGTGVVGQIIDQLLGNRYNVTDRAKVSRCASAAMTQARSQYGYDRNRQGYGQRGYGQNAYGQNGYGQNAYANLRVSAITSVERRNRGLRVSGLIDSSGGYGAYRGQSATRGDLTFRCTVADNGQVTKVRIGRNSAYRR